jgi:hypothetical protein
MVVLIGLVAQKSAGEGRLLVLVWLGPDLVSIQSQILGLLDLMA